MKTKGRRDQVRITLSPELVEKAREYGLNISRITEQALLSILGCLETQNIETSSEFLSSVSFPKKIRLWIRLGTQMYFLRSLYRYEANS